MIKNIVFQVFSLMYFTTFGQEVSLNKIGYVPEPVSECSGVAKLPSGNFAMINDSGNEPEVFIVDHSGKLLKTFYLPDVCNIDWEELAYDEGHLYIGDFGNNANERKDLAILKYAVSDSDELSRLEIIKFQYADQKEFPPGKRKMNYDLEAMIHTNDSIFIFTKNRTKPFDGYTYLYGMPDVAGSYTVERIDSFKTGVGEKDFWWIAGADLSPNGRRLVLLGYDKMWIFYDFKNSDFFGGKHEVLAFPSLSQKESVTFTNNFELIITDERNRYGGGKIYHVVLDEPKDFKVEVGPKVFEDHIDIKLNRLANATLRYEVFDTKGKRILAGTFPDNLTDYSISTQSFAPGGYVIHILLGEKPHAAYKLKKLYLKTNK